MRGGKKQKAQTCCARGMPKCWLVTCGDVECLSYLYDTLETVLYRNATGHTEMILNSVRVLVLITSGTDKSPILACSGLNLFTGLVRKKQRIHPRAFKGHHTLSRLHGLGQQTDLHTSNTSPNYRVLQHTPHYCMLVLKRCRNCTENKQWLSDTLKRYRNATESGLNLLKWSLFGSCNSQHRNAIEICAVITEMVPGFIVIFPTRLPS